MLNVLILTVENKHHNSQRFNGRGFPFFHTAFFSPFPSNWQVSLICKPGALIERLAQEVVLLTHKLPETSKSYRVFKAGICNLTQKIKHQFGSEVLHNRSQENSNL